MQLAVHCILNFNTLKMVYVIICPYRPYLVLKTVAFPRLTSPLPFGHVRRATRSTRSTRLSGLKHVVHRVPNPKPGHRDPGRISLMVAWVQLVQLAQNETNEDFEVPLRVVEKVSHIISWYIVVYHISMFLAFHHRLFTSNMFAS